MCRIMFHLILPHHSYSVYQNFYAISILLITNTTQNCKSCCTASTPNTINLQPIFNQMTRGHIYKSELVGCYNLAFVGLHVLQSF